MCTPQNEHFHTLLNEISRIINNSLGGDVTILLLGAHARNDGRFDSNGHPLGDIDLAVIVHNNAYINITEIKQNIVNSSLLYNLVIDLHLYTLDSLINVLPFWRFYDLKHNSILISGKDIRPAICNFNHKDISKYDGLRMLVGELVKTIKRGSVDEGKLYFVLKSAESIKNACYSGRGEYYKSKTSMDEYATYALRYYRGGFRKSAKSHLQPTINYIVKKKLPVNIKVGFFFSFIVQVCWTLLWAIKIKNARVLSDWRDPALRIYYSIIYYFSSRVTADEKMRLFKEVSYPDMEYTEENLTRLYDDYFHGDRWKSVKKSSWTSDCKIVVK